MHTFTSMITMARYNASEISQHSEKSSFPDISEIVEISDIFWIHILTSLYVAMWACSPESHKHAGGSDMDRQGTRSLE